ncbi:DUF4136 domain-containing protein [Acidipila sp. EB88]|uniref:DUF4136 domain-containing protein n=1 Tax=Acidipila sp. EB88 TaxID=2305226 RepID=UPI000F5DD2D2|nr:DUF4136 domain-containing protein [Acidipila sp. EB88]RRA48502.1 DUF4136 domain-containing protein [Acidipila sp. EB88]
MPRPFSFALALSATTLCLALAAHAADVRTDYDHQASFANYHTYSWGTVKTDNPLYVDRIKSAVNADLQAKGWQMVPSGGSATIFATGSIRNEQQIETMYSGMGGGWGGGWGWNRFGGGFGGGGLGEATTTTTQQPVGNLVLDIFDTANHQLLFRGISSEDLSKNADKNTRNLNKNIDKMFKNFPPKGNG